MTDPAQMLNADLKALLVALLGVTEGQADLLVALRSERLCRHDDLRVRLWNLAGGPDLPTHATVRSTVKRVGRRLPDGVAIRNLHGTGYRLDGLRAALIRLAGATAALPPGPMKTGPGLAWQRSAA